ncbi:hypothetical protein [Flaviaesturariibacter amylovorans]|uniref:Uncharacterized protein n=1 Tax=Flaviaesturariibacter amylovorans TaxID=1084520 RepID=A0ABP8GJY1_9BACT
MKANFEIELFRDIRFENRHIDLHNNFLFEGFNYDLAKAQVTLHWVKDTGDWISSDELAAIAITHFDVTFFKVQPMSETVPLIDSQTLSEVTFYPSDERNEDERFLDQSVPDVDDDIIYSFLGGQIIRIGCSVATLQSITGGA